MHSKTLARSLALSPARSRSPSASQKPATDGSYSKSSKRERETIYIYKRDHLGRTCDSHGVNVYMWCACDYNRNGVVRSKGSDAVSWTSWERGRTGGGRTGAEEDDFDDPGAAISAKQLTKPLPMLLKTFFFCFLIGTPSAFSSS